MRGCCQLRVNLLLGGKTSLFQSVSRHGAATVFNIKVTAVMEVEPVELALAACLGTMATTENMETTL